MKYLETGTINPYYNLALEEYILKNFTDSDYLILWQNNNSVIVGLHQNTYEEINVDAVNELNVNVVRRITGGGAVYHDLGNLNFSYITDWNQDIDDSFKKYSLPIIGAINKVGVDAYIEGRNDILVNGKKISGSAQSLFKNRLLHHGTLLINTDLEVLSNVLIVSSEKIQSKGVKSIRSRVTNVQEYAKHEVKIEEIKKLIIEEFAKIQPIAWARLSKKDTGEVERLEKFKYRDWYWNYGRSPNFNYKNKKKYPGGTIEINYSIKDGIVESCMINGDFLALKSVSFVENLLTGQKYDKCSLKKVLLEIPIDIYFGTITIEDLMDCFFN